MSRFTPITPPSVFANLAAGVSRASVVVGVGVALAGIGCAALAWFVGMENKEEKALNLKTFVENAILVAQKEGTLGAEDTVLRLGQISRPREVEFFLFNGEHELVYSSRVEMNVGMNFSSWLVKPDKTLARFVQETPPGSSVQFSTTLQPVRNWKPKPGDAFLSYIPGSAHYMLAFQEGVSREDLRAEALAELTPASVLAVCLGIFAGGLHAYGMGRKIRQQNALWDEAARKAANSIITSVKARKKIAPNDAGVAELRNFLGSLRPLDVLLANIAQTEALIGSAEESARAVLNAVNEVILVVDHKDEIVWANHRAEEFLELPRSSLLGTSLPLYGAEPGLEVTLRTGLNAARQGAAGTFLWSCRKMHSGQVFPVEVWASKISLQSSDAICVALRDISAQRKTEAELKRMVQDLQTALERGEALVRSQGVFLARMSHEIRAPINAVIGLCQLGQQASSEESPEATLQRIESSARELLRVVDDVLDCAKLEAGKISLFKQPFSLEKLLQEVGRFCKVRASGKPLHFEVKAAPELPPNLLGDAGRIKQILINFCENAIKFTQAGVITVEAGPGLIQPGMIRFRVTDSGIGIPASKQHQLFQDFSQADPTIGRQYGGSGLGLSICKMLVDAMQGKIGLISAEGQGSTFWFEIPLEAAELLPADGSQTMTAEIPEELRGRRVLLADDEDINRAVITRMLQVAGCEVEACGDGAEAFEKILGKDYDLALLDLEMPEMDGFRTLESIRKLPGSKGKLPTFAMSSHLREHMADRVLRAGFSGYLSKPLDAFTLYPALAQALKGEPSEHGSHSPSPPSPSSDISSHTFDPESGRQRLGGDLTLFDAMTSRFLDRWCSDGGQLLSTLHARGEEAIRLAHTLRGAAATIGAQEVAELAAAIESGLRNNQSVEMQVAELPTSLAKVKEAILLQRQTAGR